jgi:hypothetical protein
MNGKFSSLLLTLAIAIAFAQSDSSNTSPIVVPKAWADADLAEWATPLPVLGARPGLLSEAEFYKIPIRPQYRAYPVYHPDREPKGYWEWVQKQPPKPLLEPEKLHSQNDWLEAGRTVFQELYLAIGFPELIPLVRSASALRLAGIETLPDGTLPLRWVVTPDGIRLAGQGCQGCHARYLPDSTRIDGAPGNAMIRVPNLLQALTDKRRERSDAELAQLRQLRYAQWAVPWLKDDLHAAIKSMSWEDFDELYPFDLEYRVAIQARANGSPFYPTKSLDLIGIRGSKYLNHTATHLHRGIADLMRYGLLVECCDVSIFGPHQMLPPERRLPRFRYSDEVMFALATYIYSLEPPPNPNSKDSRAVAGKKIFARERCDTCHTPPLYTNNKLTLAKGFSPPDDHPDKKDIMRVSVGTDPGQALRTRKGTGFYRVPSLKGVWYRGLYGHHGDVASLEEWFDPARLRDDYVPSGWKGYKTTHRAVPGHEFGLTLSQKDKQALIAFLKTL